MEPSLVDTGKTFNGELMEAVKGKIAELTEIPLEEIERDYEILRLHPVATLVENNYFNQTGPCRVYSVEELESNGINLFLGDSVKLSYAEGSDREIDRFIESIVPADEFYLKILANTSITKILRGDRQAVSYDNRLREAIAVIPQNSILLERNLEFLGEEYDVIRQWLVDNDLIHQDGSP